MIKIKEVFKTNKCGEIEIIEYFNKNKILIKFLKTEYVRFAKSCNIRSGEVNDVYTKNCFEVGYEGEGSYSYKVDKIACCAFSNMHRRCFSKNWSKKDSAYYGCSVAKEWHNFQNFCKWFYSKESNYHENYHIDKDLLIENNKIYSSLTCIYIEQSLNKLFTGGTKTKNNLPLGVSKNNKKYRARCYINGKLYNGIMKDTIEEANIDYIKLKIKSILFHMNKNNFPNVLIEPLNGRITKMNIDILRLKEKLLLELESI